MESVQYTKRRLRGVQNIGQITKAMELVAANKMRRSQETALASRPYAFAALDFLATLSRLETTEATPLLLQKREIKRRCIVLVTSDKGLAGSFNSAVIREFEKFVKANGIELRNIEKYAFVAVGQKAASYLKKRAVGLEKKFVRVGDFTTIEETKPLADFLINGYLKAGWDQVIVFSTHFRTALKQIVFQRQILPVDVEALKTTAKEIIPESGRFAELARAADISLIKDDHKENIEYLIEPSPEAVLEELAAHLVLMQIYHLILEANASEHAARRLAMKNASDNAGELAGELLLNYNKSRQASITREIIEITAGAEALK
jgi:F-type H+-transporting ATPase subunit gamma